MSKNSNIDFSNLKLSLISFLYTSSLGHTCTFFPIRQGSYLIVASSMNIILLHYCKFHCHLLFANSLWFSFYLDLQNGSMLESYMASLQGLAFRSPKLGLLGLAHVKEVPSGAILRSRPPVDTLTRIACPNFENEQKKQASVL